MNKFLAICALTACVCTNTAYAQINEPTFGDSMDVHFTADTYGNCDITFSVFETNDSGISLDRCLYQEQGVTDKDGNYSTDFILNVPSGRYIAVLSSRRHKENEQMSFYYVNKKHLENTLNSINKAAAAKELGDILESSWEEIGADTDLINKLENKQALYERLLAKRDSDVTEENLDKYLSLIKEQSICCLADEGGLKTIKAYAAEMKLDTLDIWNDFVSSDQESKVLAGMKGSDPQNAEDFLKIFDERATVRVICGSGASGVKNMLNKYADKAGIGNEIKEIAKLTDKQQYSVYSSTALSNSTTYSALSADIEKFIDTAKNTQKTGSTGGFGGGGGGSISSGKSAAAIGAVADTTGTANTEKTTNDLPFADLNGFEWAKDAVGELYKRNIISGRDDTTFAPNDDITREEFITMLINALRLNDSSAECNFDDVERDRWSFKAIASAQKYGIAEGFEGSFNPSDKITRQDLVSMVYRALKVSDIKLSQTREYSSFGDEYKIADYAAEAVETLYKYGVVNGMTETEFAPQNMATRAQSAKILYEVIKNNAF